MRGLLLAVGVLAGCGSDDLLDGTWRQPSDSAGVGGDASYELVLGQYGPDVAGVVRQFERRGTGSSTDLYGVEQYCRQLQSGRFVSSRLTFQYVGPEGLGLSFSLKLSSDEQRLVGSWSGANKETLVEFERIDTATDPECSWLNELVIHGSFEGTLPAGHTWRATLAYLGKEGDVPCLAEADQSAAVEGTDNKVFSLTIDRKPTCFVIDRPGEVSLAWGVFLIFDDADGDGYWDRDPLPGGAVETAFGVSPDYALVYLVGSLERDVTTQSHPLHGFTDQGRSLVRIVERVVEPDSGTLGLVTRLSRVPESEVQSTSIQLVPVSPAPPATAPPTPRLPPVQ